jgi:hypothetical protein
MVTQAAADQAKVDTLRTKRAIIFWAIASACGLAISGGFGLFVLQSVANGHVNAFLDLIVTEAGHRSWNQAPARPGHQHSGESGQLRLTKLSDCYPRGLTMVRQEPDHWTSGEHDAYAGTGRSLT